MFFFFLIVHGIITFCFVFVPRFKHLTASDIPDPIFNYTYVLILVYHVIYVVVPAAYIIIYRTRMANTYLDYFQ